MWEAAAYSQNLFKVMLDPLSWGLAFLAMFALTRLPVAARAALALAASFLYCLVFLVWPAGESGKYYAWLALSYELAATGTWLFVLFIARRIVIGRMA